MNGGAFVSTYYNSEQEYKEFIKDVEKYRRYKFCSSEKEKFKSKLETTIKQNFKNYINAIIKNANWKTEQFTADKINQKEEYILDKFEVKIINLIVDRSFNNERVYYFDFINKYIVV